MDGTAEIGKPAPAFELKDLSGRTYSLPMLKGKVVLLSFWATTCLPCKAEMPSLNNLYEGLKNEGFLVLAVSVDASEKAVRSFVSSEFITFPVLTDTDREVSFDRYAVFGLPTSFLIGRNGIIVDKFVGERAWDNADMKKRILRLLGER